MTILLVLLLASTLPYAPAAKGQSPAPDNTLVVCVGAHPDDLDIGISGALYKQDVGKHPMLWVVVTDGGADLDEYQYETNSSRNWLAQDGQVAVAWKAPDGSNVTRLFYSADLARKRCGGYFEGLNWNEEAASHNSSFGVEYDWRTRVSNLVGATIEKSQLSYMDPSDPTKRLTYPDGALANAEIAYTNDIALNIAHEITKSVESNGYQKSLIKIYSHATEEVCTNANDHPDHRITGNAVRQAIDILHETFGFGQIDSEWFTIYTPIDPKSGYVRVDDDISQQKTQKSGLAKACWETDAINSRSINYTWKDYPEDPGQYEYTIVQSHYAPSPTPHLVVRGSNNISYYRTYSVTTDSWNGWTALPGATSESPAAAVCNNELHVVVRGSSGNQLYHGYVNLTTNAFSGWTLLSGSTPSAPTLTSNGTVLSIVVRGGDNRIYYRMYSFSPSRSWGSWSVVPTGTTPSSPAAAMLGNNLHIVVKGMDGASLWNIIVKLGGGVVRNWIGITGSTPSKPVLAANQTANKLYLTVRGGDNRVYWRTYSGATDSWAGWNVVLAGTTSDAPGATVVDNKLHIVMRNMTGTTLWHGNIDLGTTSFSGWTLLSGSTPSAPTLTS